MRLSAADKAAAAQQMAKAKAVAAEQAAALQRQTSQKAAERAARAETEAVEKAAMAKAALADAAIKRDAETAAKPPPYSVPTADPAASAPPPVLAAPALAPAPVPSGMANAAVVGLAHTKMRKMTSTGQAGTMADEMIAQMRKDTANTANMAGRQQQTQRTRQAGGTGSGAEAAGVSLEHVNPVMPSAAAPAALFGPLHGKPAGVGSRRRDCHFDDTPCSSLLKHLLEVQGGAIK